MSDHLNMKIWALITNANPGVSVHKLQEAQSCVLCIPATDAMVLKQQIISIHRAN